MVITYLESIFRLNSYIIKVFFIGSAATKVKSLIEDYEIVLLQNIMFQHPVKRYSITPPCTQMQAFPNYESIGKFQVVFA